MVEDLERATEIAQAAEEVMEGQGPGVVEMEGPARCGRRARQAHDPAAQEIRRGHVELQVPVRKRPQLEAALDQPREIVVPVRGSAVAVAGDAGGTVNRDRQ